MHATGPVATAQPQGDLDTMAYGQPYSCRPGGRDGASSARCRTTFVAACTAAMRSPRSSMPRHRRRWLMTSAYRLDAGDRLRIVVYGQEGLTNTYAIDAGG